MNLCRPRRTGRSRCPKPWRKRERRLAWLGAFLIGAGIFLVSSGLSAFADGTENSEYRLKLAFLYNFAQFVQWPADTFANASAPLRICVVGENPFSGEIEQGLRGRFVAGHPVELRQL